MDHGMYHVVHNTPFVVQTNIHDFQYVFMHSSIGGEVLQMQLISQIMDVLFLD